jgi:hypothetical protein
MRRLLINIGIFFLLVMSFALHAQAATTLATPQSKSQSTPATGGVKPTDSHELVLLRAQLEATKEFNGSILDTVYWALGGTFVLAGLLLGFGWLANFKVYERDKSAMKSELEAAVAVKIGELESAISARMAEVPSLLVTQTKESIAQSEKSIKGSLATLSRKIFDLEFRYLTGRMESNPSDNMALTDALGLFRLCVNKAPDEIPDIMHFMLKTIDQGGKLTATEITELNELLDSLPTHYRTLTEKLRAKLVASDIF